VFSSWKKTTDAVAYLCAATNIKFKLIDGTTRQVDRARAVEQFKNDPSISVLIMTLGTGALGWVVARLRRGREECADELRHRLNLTAATRIHVLEPQWNPALEEQAIGRAIRIGQHHRTTVIRYIVLNSIEEVGLSAPDQKSSANLGS